MVYNQSQKISGHILRGIVRGRGRAMILLHGHGACSKMWVRLIPLLSRQFKVYALDLLGSGRSDLPLVEYSPDFYCQQVEEFMRVNRLDSPILVGGSWGAKLAALLTVRNAKN